MASERSSRPTDTGRAGGDTGQSGLAVFGPRGVRFFLVSWLLLSVLGTVWALGTPLFASPDEPAQVVKAAAVARGELTGTTIEQPGTYFEIITEVDVPAYYEESFDFTECFINDTSESAACAGDFDADDSGEAEVPTWIGRYPPLYYAVVGLPSLLVDGEAAVLAMRTAGAVLCSALFALGLTALRSTPRPTAVLAAGFLAITPTAAFYAGVVNSNGLEIAAGMATWCLLLPVAIWPTAYRMSPRLLWGAAAGVVLVNSRPGSALMAVLIGLVLVVVARREFWRRALTGRVWVWPVVVVVLGGLGAAAWLLVVDPTESLGGIPDPNYADTGVAISTAVGLTPRYVREQLAVFGTLNLPAHPTILWLLGATVALLVLAGIVFGRGARRWGLVLLTIAVFVVPVVAQLPSAADLGLIWQGRYGLPFSIGLPIVAMAVLVSGRERATWPTWLAVPVVLVAMAGHVGSVLWSLWRYAIGFGTDPIGAPVAWQPPGGVWLLAGAAFVAVALLGATVLAQDDSSLRRGGRPRPPADADVPQPAGTVGSHTRG